MDHDTLVASCLSMLSEFSCGPGGIANAGNKSGPAFEAFGGKRDDFQAFINRERVKLSRVPARHNDFRTVTDKKVEISAQSIEVNGEIRAKRRDIDPDDGSKESS